MSNKNLPLLILLGISGLIFPPANPHPNQTGVDAARSREEAISGKHARKWGWTDEMMKEMSKIIQENPVPSRQQERDSWNLAERCFYTPTGRHSNSQIGVIPE